MHSDNDVLDAIRRECEYQDKTWGKTHYSVAGWMMLMHEEIEEARVAWMKEGDERALGEILQATAVASQCIASCTDSPTLTPQKHIVGDIPECIGWMVANLHAGFGCILDRQRLVCLEQFLRVGFCCIVLHGIQEEPNRK